MNFVKTCVYTAQKFVLHNTTQWAKPGQVIICVLRRDNAARPTLDPAHCVKPVLCWNLQALDKYVAKTFLL